MLHTGNKSIRQCTSLIFRQCCKRTQGPSAFVETFFKLIQRRYGFVLNCKKEKRITDQIVKITPHAAALHFKIVARVFNNHHAQSPDRDGHTPFHHSRFDVDLVRW